MILKYRFTSLRSPTYPQSLKYLEQCDFSASNRTAILMLNLGGPNSREEISPFLLRFFQDSTVIRIPFGLGPLIARLRGPAKINKQYERIGGFSPLLKWTQLQGSLMQKPEGAGFLPAFRYGLPLQEDAIEYAIEKTEGKLINFVLFSQYPQYSCSTGGNAIRNALSLLSQYKEKYPQLRATVIDSWHSHPLYIQALANIIKEDLISNRFNPEETQILFTAHSLPADFVWEGDKYPYFIFETCQLTINELKKIGVKVNFDLSFQSKVGLNKWLRPSTEHNVLARIKTSNYRNFILTPMGFTSDHLETLYELDADLIPRAQEAAKKVEKQIIRGRSLNNHPIFIQALSNVLSDAIENSQTFKGKRDRCVDCKFELCDIVNNNQL